MVGNPFRSPSIRVHGNLGLVKQFQTTQYDPTRGWSKVMKWEGPRGRALSYGRQLVRDWKNVGVDIAISVSEDVGGSAVLEASLPPDINPVETIQWSLDGNDLEKPIETHPMLANIRDEEIELLRRVKANPQYLITQWQSEMTSSSQPTGIAVNTFRILSLIKRGVEVYSISQWTLRRSAVHSSYATSQIALSNVGRQFTLAQLIAMEGLNNIKFSMPSTGYWIKRTPKVATEGIRTKVETEYWHVDAASVYLYPFAT